MDDLWPFLLQLTMEATQHRDVEIMISCTRDYSCWLVAVCWDAKRGSGQDREKSESRNICGGLDSHCYMKLVL